MKKLIAMLLCVALVAALSVSAFAADPAPTPHVEDPLLQIDPPAPSAQDAVRDDIRARNTAAAADLQGTWAAFFGEVIPVVEAWEAVRDDVDSTAAERAAAYALLGVQLGNIAADYNADLGGLTFDAAEAATTFANFTDPLTYNGWATSPIQLTDGSIVDTASEVAGYRVVAQRSEAALLVTAAQYAMAVEYDMSDGTVMDWNSYLIAATGLQQAQDTLDAAAAAAAAKAAAITAQSTAKTLINAAMGVAQLAAAEAVANAQTTAYNELSAAYANAVSEFWAGVSAEIATW